MLGLTKWGFRATLKVHASENSVEVAPGKLLADFVRLDIPLIDEKKKLWLNPLLFNGTLQTLYYGAHNSKKQFLVYYGRELFHYEDGGVCSLDWVIEPESRDVFERIHKETMPENWPKLHPRTRFLTSSELLQKTAPNQEGTDPICVVVHGLAGGSHEPLIRNLGEYLSKNSGAKWDTVVVNSRGCARTKITTGKLFTAFSTDDIKDVLVDLKRRFPYRPLYAVGFSFGAVLVANLLGSGDEEVNSMVKAAVCIGCPWDMGDSSYHLQDSLLGHYMFNPNLITFLNKLIKSNLKELQHHLPDFFSDENVAKARKVKELWEWDEIFTAKAAGFRNARDYYRQGSPILRMHKIQVPTLIINSTDDPAVSTRLPILDVKCNPHLVMVESNLGGHLGFVKFSGEFWCVEAADEFLNKFHEIQH